MNGFLELKHGIQRLCRWAFALVFLLASAAPPALHTTVSLRLPDNTAKWLLAQAAVVVAWVIVEARYDASLNTSLGKLQVENVLNFIWALVMSAITISLFWTWGLPWFAVIPWLGSLLVAGVTAYFTVNNAARSLYKESERYGERPPRQ